MANWRPRFVANGVDALDLERILARVDSWERWADAWAEAAEAYERLGTAAQDEGHPATAASHLVRAALLYQFAHFVLTDDLDRRRALHRRQCDVYRRAAPLLRPPAVPVAIEHDGATMPGYLRAPEGPRPAPLAVLVPGLESTKEQFSTLEPFFLERGVATLSIEGPGQGECDVAWSDARWQDAFAHALEVARGLPGVDDRRVALVGTSFGGYLVLKAAARAEAAFVVDIAGPHDLAEFDELQEVTRESFAVFAGASSPGEARAAAAEVSLEGHLEAVRARVLVVHGERDGIVPPRHARLIADALGDRAELWLLPEGNHSCNNLHTTVRPALADRVADALGASA